MNAVWGDGWAAVRDAWGLDPEVAFLNHGSFGATPRAVLALHQRLREDLERNPVDFLTRRLPGMLAAARTACAAFLGADPDGFAFVGNATTGVATVLASLGLREGDEIVLTDHAYPAARNAVARTCEQTWARAVEVAVSFPTDAGDPAAAIAAR